MMGALAQFLGDMADRHPRDAYLRAEKHLAGAREQIVRQAGESGVPLLFKKGLLVAVAVAAEYAGHLLDVPGLGVGAATLGVVSGLSVNVASAAIRHAGSVEHHYRYLHLVESEIKRSGLAS